MAHLEAATGEISAPLFDRAMAEKLKTKAVVLKQLRLSREEEETENKHNKKKDPKGGGKGKDD